MADSSGFTGSSGELRWTVERINPQDGVLGTHYGPFSVDDLGQTYGEGTYKVTRHDPGKQVAMEYVRKIASSYGRRRNPSQSSSPEAAPARPFLQRPWDPASGGVYDPAQGAGQQAAPGVPPRPFYYRDYYAPLQDFARHREPSADGSVATEALRQMGEQNKRLVEQQERARQAGPETSLVQLIQAQQDMWNQRWEEERKREDRRREDEEKKWDRNQQLERDRWERDQKAAKEAHDRELARIKEDNAARLAELKLQADERDKREQERQNFIMEFENKRLDVIKQEAQVHKDRLESELSQTREQMGKLQEATAQELHDTREATTNAIAANKQELEQRLKEKEAQLDKEYRLRERGLDKEHELTSKMLDMQKQQIESQAGDQLMGMIQTVIKEASKSFERYTDLAKLQAMTPEAQAAAIQRGAVDGNVMGAPAQAAPAAQQEPPQRQPSPAAPAPAQAAAGAHKPAGNGHAQQQQPAAPNGEAGGADRMETLLRKGLETQEGREMFQNVISEWALHVSVGNDPSVFATLYLEMLRDEKNGEVRKFSALFFAIMSARPWAKMFAFLRPYLDQESVQIFQKPEAEKFYEAFRAMVYYTMSDYWRQIMVATQQQQGAQAPPQAAVPQPDPGQPVQAAPQAPAPVAPALAAPTMPSPQQFRTINPIPAGVPVEPNGAGANPQAPQGVPVPTRDALRQAS